MLTRRITLDEHFAEYLDLVQRGLVDQALIDGERAQLAARAQPGDEWWEWLLGTEPLRQMGGIALVRHGKVVWAKNTWIS
jgi:hypothetical protein